MSNEKASNTASTKMEVRPKGFWSRHYEILSQGLLVGTSRQGFWGRIEIDIETGDALLIKRRGFLFDYYELRLRGSEDVLGVARGRGFLRRCYDVEIGDVRGLIEPSTWFGKRRDYSVNGKVVATTERRGIFSRGFLVTGNSNVSEVELLFFGWVAYIIRQQQDGGSSSN